jgi:phospholipase/lecithinase/hemolysin
MKLHRGWPGSGRLAIVGAATVGALLVAACDGGGNEAASSSSSAGRDLDQGGAVIAAATRRADAVAAAISSRAATRQHGRQQVIVFGDSLSDVGTYRVGPVVQLGGGKFTTNPGPVWCESVGFLLGASVTPFRQGLGGVSQVLGGTGFAMGGARVSQQPGIGCQPDPTTAVCTAALTIPVTEQIADFLAANGDHFADDQFAFLLAGGNDILFQLGVFQAKLQAGVTLLQAQNEALAAIQQAAIDLESAVQGIISKGARRVVVINLPDIADTPAANVPSVAPARPLISAMVQLFNDTLAAGLAGTSALVVDLHAEMKRVLENPAAFHVVEPRAPACDLEKIAALTGGAELGGSSLFCSPATLVSPVAPFTYLYADSDHPSTLGHLIIARLVVASILDAGLFQ